MDVFFTCEGKEFEHLIVLDIALLLKRLGFFSFDR